MTHSSQSTAKGIHAMTQNSGLADASGVGLSTLCRESAVLLDVKATTRLLGCSPRHVYRLSDSARMPPPVKIGALVRWRRSDVERRVAEGCPTCRQGTR